MTDPVVTAHPSPNCGPRRDGLRPELVVIHYTAMASAKAARDRLCEPDAEVSAHYLIANDGCVMRLVEEEMRAWHAGEGAWQGRGDVNSRSIGIELDNTGAHPFSELQMTALEGLLAGILQRWSIRPEGVIGHSDMAPGRKSDPGSRFDWARLARRGLAGPATGDPAPAEATPQAFRAAARAAGYTADVDLDTLLSATRLRFAPWRTGPLQPADLALHHGLSR